MNGLGPCPISEISGNPASPHAPGMENKDPCSVDPSVPSPFRLPPYPRGGHFWILVLAARRLQCGSAMKYRAALVFDNLVDSSW